MEQQQKEKIEGAGSLWNVNSWHWEAKDYTAPARELLESKLFAVVLEQDGIKVTLKKIKNWDGSAEICIRKQKQKFIYDLTLDIEWFAESKDEEATGTLVLRDIAPDDLDYQIDKVKSEEKTGISKDAERLIKKELKKHLDVFLETFAVDFLKHEASKNPEKLKEDAQKRQEIADSIKKAREENGDKKQQIFEEQKLKEQQMRQENSQWK